MKVDPGGVAESLPARPEPHRHPWGIINFEKQKGKKSGAKNDVRPKVALVFVECPFCAQDFGLSFRVFRGFCGLPLCGASLCRRAQADDFLGHVSNGEINLCGGRESPQAESKTGFR